MTNITALIAPPVPVGESPRRARGSLIGMVNEREFGVAFLEANITDNPEEGTSTLEAHVDNIPPSVGELLSVCVCVCVCVVYEDMKLCVICVQVLSCVCWCLCFLPSTGRRRTRRRRL